jgi:Beta-lactamase
MTVAKVRLAMAAMGQPKTKVADLCRENNSRSDKLVLLMTLLAGLMVGVSICNGTAPTQDEAEPIWPTKEWQTSSPEEQGMDSKELAELVDFGTTHSFDSLLVARHGRIVAEAYYAPYTAGIPHEMHSATKAVISTLTAIALKDGLLDNPSHRVLDFFDRRSIANLDERKEAITVQNLLDMTSGLEWTEPLGGRPDSDIEMERSPDWSSSFSIDRWRALQGRPSTITAAIRTSFPRSSLNSRE